MHSTPLYLICLFALSSAIFTFILASTCDNPHGPQEFLWEEGGIRRGSVRERKLSVVFTGSDFAEQTAQYLDTLRKFGNLKASFFVTGTAVRLYASLLKQILAEGHHLSWHSYSHTLLCDWDQRNKTLVPRDFFVNDIQTIMGNLSSQFGVQRDRMQFYLPQYEWYNTQISTWTSSAPLNLTLCCFTRGTLSSADYAPEGDKAFRPSSVILDSILQYERKDPYGMNGFILLLHMGTDNRKDKFVDYMPQLLSYLLDRGYEFVTIDELLCTK